MNIKLPKFVTKKQLKRENEDLKKKLEESWKFNNSDSVKFFVQEKKTEILRAEIIMEQGMPLDYAKKFLLSSMETSLNNFVNYYEFAPVNGGKHKLLAELEVVKKEK